MQFSGTSIRSTSLNSVDRQSAWLYLSLTHFPVFAKNRRDTAEVHWSVLCCPAVCREQVDMARKAQVFPGSIFPSTKSESQNHRTAGGVQSSLLFRAGLRPVQLTQGSVQLISAVSTRTQIHSLSGSLFKYLTTLAGFPPCPVGILVSISHISSCAHHFPGHPKRSLYVSTLHPPIRGL